MLSTPIPALFGLFALALLAGGFCGLVLLIRRPSRDPHAEPFGDVPRRRR
jgi:hypothetical protein